MSWELVQLFGYTIVFIAVGTLIYANLHQIFLLEDLESDYINPYDLAARINFVVTKEFLVQGALCILFLLTQHWFMLLLSAPVTYYHFRLYKKRKHLIDVTEAFTVLSFERHYRLVKLGFYVTLCLTLMFSLTATAAHLIVGEDIGLHRRFWFVAWMF
ncbi:hypothetical protein IFM89_006925 [Coptis chinensis]|uniref:Protein cornichon homolog 1 n=1 Tax=Coptis chinensis TaxID=261450 RepID=A0A835HD86_9MAGN|nr:hypothetical protein IFM89_006925 [Coptis chinensis]